jgi:hypothetical protein
LVGRIDPTTIIGRGLQPFDARIEIFFIVVFRKSIYIYIYEELSSEKSVN